MKKLTILFVGMFALAMVAPLSAADDDKPAAPGADQPAAKARKKPGNRVRGAKGERPGKTLRELDKNGNHQIDGDEVDALKKQFAAEQKSGLGRFDKNADSKLDDAEVKAINAVMAKRGEGKAGGERRKKKNL